MPGRKCVDGHALNCLEIYMLHAHTQAGPAALTKKCIAVLMMMVMKTCLGCNMNDNNIGNIIALSCRHH